MNDYLEVAVKNNVFNHETSCKNREYFFGEPTTNIQKRVSTVTYSNSELSYHFRFNALTY